MTRKQVALQEGLHEETVLGIFKRWAKRAVRRSERRPVRVLGIDEIYLGDKEYALVLSDIERHRVIAVLPNRLKATLEQWLDELSDEERRAIKVVSMDMWEVIARLRATNSPTPRLLPIVSTWSSNSITSWTCCAATCARMAMKHCRNS